jgi:hypothetical protein
VLLRKVNDYQLASVRETHELRCSHDAEIERCPRQVSVIELDEDGTFTGNAYCALCFATHYRQSLRGRQVE